MTSFKSTMFYCLFFVSICAHAQNKKHTVSSPNKQITVDFGIEDGGQPYYNISRNNIQVLQKSRLGLVRKDGSFSEDLKLVGESAVTTVKDQYTMVNAKKKQIVYVARKKVFNLQAQTGERMDIIFQVSDDGVAFRYFFPGKANGVKIITEEHSAYRFPSGTHAWLQPMSAAKSGWEKTNPAYEEHYRQNISVDSAIPAKSGWIYPALFRYDTTWMLITESFLDSNYCASRLNTGLQAGTYTVGFPAPQEVSHDGNLLPRSALPFYSPWRVIAIGNLKTIIESTLGTDLAKPAIKIDQAFIKPGKASWSWISSKDDSIVYNEQLKYVDYAAAMHWQYCLIDVNWDRKIGYEKIQELASYAAKKNVGLLLWYNSAGDWNTVKYTPKDMLLTGEKRLKEFSRLKAMGIKGIKIDFFGGDGQSVIKYYHDILIDAAKYNLLVNFHGATLPRGWHRTYPHLLSTEAVRGFEMVTFSQADANLEPTHCAVLPFTRNAFDPMDFTPMNLYKINTRVKRQTTSAFELALSVLFLSGIQHFAESPEGMSHFSDDIKQFLAELPSSWDDVKFIDGYPGKYIVIARRSADKWYIAGINGESTPRSIELDLSFAEKRNGGYLITDGQEELILAKELVESPLNLKRSIQLKSNGGFVMVIHQ